MRKLILFACIACGGLSLLAQDVIRIPLNERMVDDKINKSLSVLPVYVFKGMEIEPFSLFGIETASEQPNLVIRKMPDLTNIRDTAFTYVYFSGANTNINQGYCLTLIGNYRRSRRPIYFYIDRNNNLDFTDDGPPDSLTMMDNETIFKLQNQDNKTATHWVKITRIEYGQNMSYKKLLEDHFIKHSGGKTFTDINFCYREQRLNTVGGSFTSGNDSFIIAIKDFNNNGIFNESCMDKLYVGSVHDEISTDEMSFVLPNISDLYFEWNKKRYQVVNIDPAGSYIDVRWVKDEVLTKKLEVGEKIQQFSFINIKNQKEEIKQYKRKPVYIFFWDKTKITKEDTMFVRMIYEEFSDQIQLITLNHGDAPRSVRIIQYYDQVLWPMAFSSHQIGKIFYLEDLPRGYYLGKKLRLLNDDMSPERMYEVLKTLTK